MSALYLWDERSWMFAMLDMDMCLLQGRLNCNLSPNKRRMAFLMFAKTFAKSSAFGPAWSKYLVRDNERAPSLWAAHLHSTLNGSCKSGEAGGWWGGGCCLLVLEEAPGWRTANNNDLCQTSPWLTADSSTLASHLMDGRIQPSHTSNHPPAQRRDTASISEADWTPLKTLQAAQLLARLVNYHSALKL